MHLGPCPAPSTPPLCVLRRTLLPRRWANIFPAELSRQGSFEVALMVDTADNVVIAHTEPLSQPASDKVTVRRFRPRLRGTAADKWPPLGPRGALGFAALMSLAAEPGTNAPYLSFQNIFPPRVVRFNASAGAWLDVGPNPVEQVSLLLSRTALAFDRAARPLLAFARSDDNKVVVLRFEGGAWTPLGPPGLAGGVPASLAGSLVALPDGTPLVAAEPFVQPFPAPLAFNGASWVPLGTSAQLPAILSSPSNGRGASLALDRAGLPWLAYGDASNQLVVLRFDGGAWQPVGPAPLAGPFPPDVQLLQVGPACGSWAAGAGALAADGLRLACRTAADLLSQACARRSWACGHVRGIPPAGQLARQPSPEIGGIQGRPPLQLVPPSPS